MATADSEIRSRYLALALDARKVMDALVPFVERGERSASLDASVKEAIGALDSISQGASANVHSSLAFDEYEQVLTLDEIKSEDERRTVIQDLQRIAANTPGQTEAALRVLQFFFALESRALQYYNRPPVPAYSA